jgi:hypothetical protein
MVALEQQTVKVRFQGEQVGSHTDKMGCGHRR